MIYSAHSYTILTKLSKCNTWQEHVYMVTRIKCKIFQNFFFVVVWINIIGVPRLWHNHLQVSLDSLHKEHNCSPTWNPYQMMAFCPSYRNLCSLLLLALQQKFLIYCQNFRLKNTSKLPLDDSSPFPLSTL